ncbi:hypothetical protein ALP84_05211 [Pseudomonas cichorii]|uniref:Uncharacterized protein n=1 Tax=Pseudomonas cichorii TaxID=36746 RepID=A0A3M4VE88_PSECI|nr:hypothetical protein ALP84_05211 [Pseudomonas cichorii]
MIGIGQGQFTQLQLRLILDFHQQPVTLGVLGQQPAAVVQRAVGLEVIGGVVFVSPLPQLLHHPVHAIEQGAGLDPLDVGGFLFGLLTVHGAEHIAVMAGSFIGRAGGCGFLDDPAQCVVAVGNFHVVVVAVEQWLAVEQRVLQGVGLAHRVEAGAQADDGVLHGFPGAGVTGSLVGVVGKGREAIEGLGVLQLAPVLVAVGGLVDVRERGVLQFGFVQAIHLQQALVGHGQPAGRCAATDTGLQRVAIRRAQHRGLAGCAGDRRDGGVLHGLDKTLRVRRAAIAPGGRVIAPGFQGAVGVFLGQQVTEGVEGGAGDFFMGLAGGAGVIPELQHFTGQLALGRLLVEGQARRAVISGAGAEHIVALGNGFFGQQVEVIEGTYCGAQGLAVDPEHFRAGVGVALVGLVQIVQTVIVPDQPAGVEAQKVGAGILITHLDRRLAEAGALFMP